VNRKKAGRQVFYILFLCAIPFTASAQFILEDYQSLLYGKYYRNFYPLMIQQHTLYSIEMSDFSDDPTNADQYVTNTVGTDAGEGLNLEGEIDLNLGYGKKFTLKKGTVVGAGAQGIDENLNLDLIERILLTGTIGDRFYVEFDYDSERKKENLGEEKNIYHVAYLGKDDEFVKEVSVGNKELSIEDTRYIPIDEGNQDSFGVRARAGRGNFTVEGLLRYNVAYEGTKEFTGSKNSVVMDALDVEYATGKFFFLPDTQIDTGSLELYRSTSSGEDIIVDGKKFRLMSRGIDYDFDNSNGRIYLNDALAYNEELIVYYEKNGTAVGDSSLGTQAIIDTGGVRKNFNSTDFPDFPDYFDAGGKYLYLKKNAFNSYWELKNGYLLEEYEGAVLYNIGIQLLYTSNKGVNDNYNDLLSQYEIDTDHGAIFFNFNDNSGAFYPRPFPGEYPYTDPVHALNPFAPDNPVYGGTAVPPPENSVNTIEISYSYSTEGYFLDFNLVPGSVEVTINGNVLDPQYYTVDYDLGFVTFSEGVIKPSSAVAIHYRYTMLGSGDMSLFSAIGLTYDAGPFLARNVTAYETGVKGREAPEVGKEPSSALVNSTRMSLKLGAVKEDETGLYTELNGEAAVSRSNQNVYGKAVVADMEKGDVFTDIDLTDENWMLGSRSSILQKDPFFLSLDTRGNVLYKNYWKETILGGDVLQRLSWDIPSGNVFSYSEKAGPYNTADKPTGGADSSLVIEYSFSAGSTTPYVTVSKAVGGQNFSDFERLNLLLSGQDIAGSDIHVYVELLQTYDEDINANDILDGESSINDRGFSITPFGGQQTVIGTDREGKSNGRIDSEDLNNDGVLNTGSEVGAVIKGESRPYAADLGIGSSGWSFVSLDILDLAESYPDIFSSPAVLRITVTTGDSPLSQNASGKLLINRIWFSGSDIQNNSPEYLNISEVSVDEDPEVKENAFSDTFPGLYENLHGNASYRYRNELVEKVLRVYFTTDQSLSQGEEASISRAFPTPRNFSFYREFNLYLYLPPDQSVPPQMDFTLTFLSSDNESLAVDIPGSGMMQGWNTITVDLTEGYPVSLNGQSVGGMIQTGSLNILKRVSKVTFGLKAETGDITGIPKTSPFEIWLDEWHLAGSRGYWDKAFYTEGTLGYRGDALLLGGFALVSNPFVSLGYERREGYFYDAIDDQSDTYSGSFGSDFFQYLNTSVYLSRENIRPKRNEEKLPENLDMDGSVLKQSHSVKLDFEKSYIPVLEHSFDRIVTNTKDIELTKTDYRHEDSTEYNETLWFKQSYDLPFGLSQSFTFSRNWVDNDTSIVVPELSLQPSETEEATLNQIESLDINYSWKSNQVSTYMSRDVEYDGEYAPRTGEWLDSYSYKLSRLFRPPDDNLEGGRLALKTDTYGVGAEIPLEKSVGFFSSFDNEITEQNFQRAGSARDTAFTDSIHLEFPFYLLGDQRVQITPAMERAFTGDYQIAATSLTEGDILLSSYAYLFMPPFYYINPIKGLGRKKDYTAVDLFSDSTSIAGTAMNTLSNVYNLDTSLEYEKWYIPVYVGLSIDGETQRDGETYQQTRTFSTSTTNNICFKRPEGLYKKELDVSLNYSTERNYATKVIAHTFEIGASYTRLKSEHSGITLDHEITYTLQRQKIGSSKMYLFPDDPSGEISVAEMPDSDSVSSAVTFQYLWEYLLTGRPLFTSVTKSLDYEASVQNAESVKLENIYTFTDREKAASFSNIPFRLTLEHTSDYRMTENVLFGMNAKSVIGIEEKVLPNAPEGNILPSMGFEFGISLKVLF